MFEFLAGLAIGVAGWIISGLRASGGKADLERENARLEYENKKLMEDLGEPYDPAINGEDDDS